MEGDLTLKAGNARQAWLVERALAPWRGFLLWLLCVPGLFVACWFSSALSMVSAGVGLLLIPPAAMLVRQMTNHYRCLIRKWTGHDIERPYLPETGDLTTAPWGRRLSRVVSDPATWRDYGFLMADPIVGAVTAALPFALIVQGLYGWVLTLGVGDILIRHGVEEWYLFIPLSYSHWAPATAALGSGLIVLGFLIGPKMLDLYGRWGRVLLGPTERAKLALRVQHLTETRSDVVDASAAELRRIERDLHDGAQARLVAMGMSLGAIEHLLDRDPEKARLLLSEARASSAKALAELRDLVRGIHPPVLADRGVGDAVKALALDHPMPVDVIVDLPGRPEPPVESAVYFAICEMLTNIAKHSGARHAWVELGYRNGMLRATVTDDGTGGATMDGGTGLRGIERRIGAFDGVLALSSPPGGPTIVTLEVPCTMQAPSPRP